MFDVSDSVLRRALRIHHFDLPRIDEEPTDGLAFFGVRGATPINPTDFDFAAKHALRPVGINHRSLCCSIGLWNIAEKSVAVFAASTAPNLRAVQQSNAARIRANQMLESRVRFKKGVHATKSNPVGYHAFVQDMQFALQRVKNDPTDRILYDFDADDVVDVDHVGDHLHAASIDTTRDLGPTFYSSEGCQVVIGRFARSTDGKPTLGGVGGWDAFVRRLYASRQQRFVYYLFTSDDVMAAALSPRNTVGSRLRFGSSGGLVEQVQTKLNEAGMPATLKIDGDYGGKTLRAVQAFQKRNELLPDCSLGINTAQVLGFDVERAWPFH